MNDTDICVVGAGVAGCAAAAYLADNGFKVTVIEKDLREQDRIVGELMQPGGVRQLNMMGLEHMLEGFDAQPIAGYALFLRGQHFSIAYPESEMGRGLRNGKFVQKMRSYVLGHKNIAVHEGTVTNLIQDGTTLRGVSYIPKNSETPVHVHAALTIVCDGMFSSFRSQLSDAPRNVSSHFMGFILRDCTLPFPGHGHVIVAEPSPVLCYPISSTETRILIDFPGGQAPRKGEELTTFLRDKIGPQLPAEIQASYFCAVDEGKFKVMPNHLIPAKPKLMQGAVLIGDSLNMRHPLTAGGMTVALSDVRHLGRHLIDIRDHFTTEAINEVVASFYKNRYEQNASINILADALYAVMSNDDLKESCYTYLQKGGECASIPLSLLSALNRDQSELLQHFFAVAVHGAKRILLPSPSPEKVRRSFRMLKDAVHIISPLVLNEQPGLLTRATFMVAEKIF